MADFGAKEIMALRAKTSAGIGLCKEALESSNGDMEAAVAYINSKSDVVGRLHSATGAKLGLIKLALNDADGDYEGALTIINERGWATDNVEVEDKVGEGAIGTYVHGADRKTVALVEVECTTDFVAKNEKFVEFVNQLAMQAAAMKPEFATVEEIPAEKVEELTELFKREAEQEGKPAEIAERMVEGKLNKFYAEKVLLNQKWFKDDSKTMQDYVDEMTSALGEPLKVKRLLVWEFGK